MTDGPIVRTIGLTKRYGPIVALDGLDLEVPRGVVFGLLGPNGAGKTTTIRLLTGLARPTAGRAEVAGVAAGPDTPELQRRIGYLDQDPRFYGWMRGRELLELVGQLHGLRGARLRGRVTETLAPRRLPRRCVGGVPPPGALAASQVTPGRGRVRSRRDQITPDARSSSMSGSP